MNFVIWPFSARARQLKLENPMRKFEKTHIFANFCIFLTIFIHFEATSDFSNKIISIQGTVLSILVFSRIVLNSTSLCVQYIWIILMVLISLWQCRVIVSNHIPLFIVQVLSYRPLKLSSTPCPTQAIQLPTLVRSVPYLEYL